MAGASLRPSRRSRRGASAAFASAVLLAGLAPFRVRAEPDPAKAAPMTEAQIGIVLRARGYGAIDSIQRDGDVFLIRGASRYGEAVGDLVADAVTGEVRDEWLSESQARRMLRERGFEEVPEVRRDGAVLVARARRAGSDIEVTIDARSGAVTQTRPKP